MYGMNTEKQRIAIAEYCGWTDCRKSLAGLGGIPPKNAKLLPYPERHDEDWRLAPWRGLPDYLNDLNAIHTAEEAFANKQSDEVCYKYNNILYNLLGNRVGNRADKPWHWTWHATAAQRAEAFLKTIGKWEE